MGNRGGGPQIQMTVPFTFMVKRLIILSVVIWFVGQVILEQYFLESAFITNTFGLSPGKVLEFFVWQPLSYMFLHDLSPFHILFNMLILWWLGSELETYWGTRFFTVYYFVCGVGAGVIYTVLLIAYGLISGNIQPLYVPVVGASGAIFGLMLAYGIVFSERIVYFMFVFPLKAKYFVMILGGVEIVMLLNQGIGTGKVANLAHLAGILAGFLFLMGWTRWQKMKKSPSGGGARRRLRLVVDNEDQKRDPKYWN